MVDILILILTPYEKGKLEFDSIATIFSKHLANVLIFFKKKIANRRSMERKEKKTIYLIKTIF